VRPPYSAIHKRTLGDIVTYYARDRVSLACQVGTLTSDPLYVGGGCTGRRSLPRGTRSTPSTWDSSRTTRFRLCWHPGLSWIQASAARSRGWHAPVPVPTRRRSRRATSPTPARRPRVAPAA